MTPTVIHKTTLPHLDMVEKILLDILIEQGKAVVVDDLNGEDCHMAIKRAVRYPKAEVPA